MTEKPQGRGVEIGITDLAQRGEMEINRLFPSRTIRRVLLVAPPDADVTLFNYGTARRGRYWNYPPYGLGVIATHLQNVGIQVEILNLNHIILRDSFGASNEEEFIFQDVWKGQLAHTVKEFKPDLVGVTCMFTQTHNSTVDVCNALKQLEPTLPIALGGVHITNSFMNGKTARNLSQDFASVDLFFLYEGELAFKVFVNVVNRKAQPADLAQVIFNTSIDGLSFFNRLLPSEEDLNVIPAHDLMDTTELAKYGRIGSFGCLKEKTTCFSTVLSNRGCRAQCTFCSVRNFNGLGVRTRLVQSVIDELILLRDRYGVRHIMWLDDDFLYDHSRALQLFNEMVRQKVGITWDCTNGVIASSCTEELMAAAAESGCIGLNIGVESGNLQILKEIKKPGTIRHFVQAAKVLREHEQINARVFLIIGFPGETYRMILDTINLAIEMDLDWYNVTILQPLPNTPIFDSMVAQGLLDNVDFEEVRYNSGPYGKHEKQIESSKDLLASNFKDAFSGKNLDDIPSKKQLDDIWAYMNYHLNFKRLFNEKRPTKLFQQLRYVETITDQISPENAFAIYFYAFLQDKVEGRIESCVIQRLEEHLRTSSYWQARFDEFGLSLDHVRTGHFPVADCQAAAIRS